MPGSPAAAYLDAVTVRNEAFRAIYDGRRRSLEEHKATVASIATATGTFRGALSALAFPAEAQVNASALISQLEEQEAAWWTCARSTSRNEWESSRVRALEVDDAGHRLAMALRADLGLRNDLGFVTQRDWQG